MRYGFVMHNPLWAGWVIDNLSLGDVIEDELGTGRDAPPTTRPPARSPGGAAQRSATPDGAARTAGAGRTDPRYPPHASAGTEADRQERP